MNRLPTDEDSGSASGPKIELPGVESGVKMFVGLRADSAAFAKRGDREPEKDRDHSLSTSTQESARALACIKVRQDVRRAEFRVVLHSKSCCWSRSFVRSDAPMRWES